MTSFHFQAPESVLILGSGEFGLTTAYSMATDPVFQNTKITVADQSEFPAIDGASNDVSRLVRAEYQDPAYSQLAREAVVKWETEEWGAGVYNEYGRILCIESTSDVNENNATSYTDKGFFKSISAAKQLGLKFGTKAEGAAMQMYKDKDAIKNALNQPSGAPNNTDLAGLNQAFASWRGGGANAEAGIRKLRQKIDDTGRVTFIQAQAERLLFAKTPDGDQDIVLGALMASGQEMQADLTVVATGGWTPALIDLRGVASATGQVLTYLDISDQEQAALGENPAFVLATSKHFILPPSRNVIRGAQHTYGYLNPTTVPYPEPFDSFALDTQQQSTSRLVAGDQPPPAPATFTVSLPKTVRDDPNLQIPAEAYKDHKQLLDQIYPCFADRPRWSRVKLCWYLDTPTEDFLIGWHPRYSSSTTSGGKPDKGLFIATAGNGHAYKFMPVLGDKIVQAIQGTLDPLLADKWAWPAQRRPEAQIQCASGRGGRRGLILAEEMAKGVVA